MGYEPGKSRLLIAFLNGISATVTDPFVRSDFATCY